MIRNIILVVILLGIAGAVLYFLFFRKPEGEKVAFTGSVKSSFGEQNEYVNKQANFAIKYPNSWTFQIKEFDESDTTKGIRLKGKKGYIDLFWGENFKKGGCDKKLTKLTLDGEEIEVCDFVQDDGSEVWNQLVKDRGELTFWASAYAASPAAQTRQDVIQIFSTLKFLD